MDWTTAHAANAAYPHSQAQINARYAALCKAPTPPSLLTRPIVLLGGYHAPALQITSLRSRLMRLIGLPKSSFVIASFFAGTEMDRIIDSAAEQVERGIAEWRERHEQKQKHEHEHEHEHAKATSGWSFDGSALRGVDVVGISMGGLVARALAVAPFGTQQRRLVIHPRRIFTLGTPHRGARRASAISPDDAARSMRTGSAFLQHLDAALPTAPYELICLAKLRDRIVGATNTAPTGHGVIWSPGNLLFSHMCLSQDRRLLVELAAKLRGDSGLAGASAPPMD